MIQQLQFMPLTLPSFIGNSGEISPYAQRMRHQPSNTLKSVHEIAQDEYVFYHDWGSTTSGSHGLRGHCTLLSIAILIEPLIETLFISLLSLSNFDQLCALDSVPNLLRRKFFSAQPAKLPSSEAEPAGFFESQANDKIRNLEISSVSLFPLRYSNRCLENFRPTFEPSNLLIVHSGLLERRPMNSVPYTELSIREKLYFEAYSGEVLQCYIPWTKRTGIQFLLSTSNSSNLVQGVILLSKSCCITWKTLAMSMAL
ncbi:hypothetical protein DFJ43DRAFT_56643 [Lentinula guzmanii]|uniref:Uncharacterized protein n=1 Tax=Lentinula guzmanii TaxID=2804957 RepID=A0AA38JEH1_9AGAR|nr:hypothetical protein DFJ43DRAFT_56643 [Lentinula guzmanii]